MAPVHPMGPLGGESLAAGWDPSWDPTAELQQMLRNAQLGDAPAGAFAPGGITGVTYQPGYPGVGEGPGYDGGPWYGDPYHPYAHDGRTGHEDQAGRHAYERASDHGSGHESGYESGYEDDDHERNHQSGGPGGNSAYDGADEPGEYDDTDEATDARETGRREAAPSVVVRRTRSGPNRRRKRKWWSSERGRRYVFGRLLSFTIALLAALLVSMVSVFGGMVAMEPLRNVAADRTEAGLIAWWPLLVYGPWTVASLSILRAALHRRRALHSWFVVLLFTSLATVLCVTQAPRTLPGIAAAALPSLAALACFHQLVRLITMVRPPLPEPSARHRARALRRRNRRTGDTAGMAENQSSGQVQGQPQGQVHVQVQSQVKNQTGAQTRNQTREQTREEVSTPVVVRTARPVSPVGEPAGRDNRRWSTLR
ncbi:DUF2637 domain-containing protein [Streptomyces yaizuensis]|uniref:DUF2637 domain-containing protein n=1 Tax=Streptomyces yaizuensis TaxID=2989713 RepID=A0ABQ5P948_9ACTN|nr:hypothetical protein SYYSPA8_32475 [Streptomyces sp. YSPA8]